MNSNTFNNTEQLNNLTVCFSQDLTLKNKPMPILGFTEIDRPIVVCSSTQSVRLHWIQTVYANILSQMWCIAKHAPLHVKSMKGKTF